MTKELNTKGGMAKATAGADTVEIKVTVSEKKERSAWMAFGLTRQKGEQRHVYFFDTPRRDLLNKGVVLRARKIEKAPDDSTVKIRPVEPEKIGAKWRRAPA
jgi:adenylate cyclase class IV